MTKCKAINKNNILNLFGSPISNFLIIYISIMSSILVGVVNKIVPKLHLTKHLTENEIDKNNETDWLMQTRDK